MVKKIFLILFFIGRLDFLYAQNISGRILDVTNNLPVENVTVGLKETSFATISNAEGQFNLFSSANLKTKTLIFTSIGYKDLFYNIDKYDKSIIIKLQPKTISLNEINIISDLNPKTLLLEAINSIRINYQDTIKKITAYYSETYRIKNNLVSYNEVVFKINRMPYDSAIADEPIAMIKKRGIADTLISRQKVINGVAIIKENDFVYRNREIFNDTFFSKTNFFYAKNNDSSNYLIKFISKKTNDYQGKIYINKLNKVILRIELDKFFGKHKASTTIVDYRIDKGRYYLNTLKKVILKYDTKINLNLVVTAISDTLTQKKERLYLLNTDLSNYQSDFDSKFWDGYNYVKPDSLLNIEIKNLQRQNANFRLIEQSNKIEHYNPESQLLLLVSDKFEFNHLQINKNFNQLDRLINYSLSNKISTKSISSLLQMIIPMIITTPLRNVLSEKNYLANNNIYAKANFSILNSNGRSYLSQVPNQALADWKEKSIGSFLRLYTIRLENNYLAIKDLEEEIFANDLSKYNNKETFLNIYFADLFTRRFVQFSSLAFSSLLDSKNPNSINTPINANPLINYTYNLHRPNQTYEVNINKQALNQMENRFLQRVRLKSVINLISPLMIASPAFNIGFDNKVNFSLNYILATFGEVYEEKIYIKTINNNFGIFLKQYQNYNKLSFGLTLKYFGYRISSKFYTDAEFSYWKQPQNQLFYDVKFKDGFAWNQILIYNPFNKYKLINRVGFVAGFTAKSVGYMPDNYDFSASFSLLYGIKVKI